MNVSTEKRRVVAEVANQPLTNEEVLLKTGKPLKFRPSDVVWMLLPFVDPVTKQKGDNYICICLTQMINNV